MKLDELIRLLKLGDPEKEVINGFGGRPSTYRRIAFGPRESTTIGRMITMAELAASTADPSFEVWIAPGGQTGERITLPMVLSWLGCGDALPGPRLEPVEEPDLTDLERLLEEYAGFVQGENDSRTAQQWVDAIYCAVIDAWFGCHFWAVFEANRGGTK